MKVLMLVLVVAAAAATPADYAASRERFLEREASQGIGAGLELTTEESIVDENLMTNKRREIQMGLRDPSAFPPANHFFKAKKVIEESQVFTFIKRMPKGAVLHVHDTGLVSTDYLVSNLTYRENLYSCLDTEGHLHLHFFSQPDNSCVWKKVAELRREQGAAQVDRFLRRHLSLVVDNPEEEYPNIDAVWTKFSGIFSTLFGMVTYKPVFEDYYYQTLQEFFDDGVAYMELRGILPDLYDLNGTTYSGVQVMDVYKGVTTRFKEDHQSFFGARFIYAPSRRANDSVMDGYVEMALALQRAHPDFLLGFDLVGQEDPGRPLKELVGPLLRLAPHMPFFFHAGETNWQGLTDENMVDAVLLNTTRIGHGFALPKHPVVLELVRQRSIAIEVNPISNQVLKLVADLRNHPCSMLLAQDYPVVIGADDPSFWGAKGVSYDIYLAFMGMSPMQAGLRLLKQLAINSIKYTGLGVSDKELLEALWQQQWTQFIAGLITNSSDVSVEQIRG